MRKLLVALILLVALPLGAARNFVRASSNRLNLGAALVTSPPYTFSGWFRITTATNQNYGAISTGSADANNRSDLRLSGSTGADQVQMSFVAGGVESKATTSPAYTINSWFHAAGIVFSDKSTAAFIHGGNKATAAASSGTPSGINKFAIGAQHVNSWVNHMEGDSAEVGVWNVALTDDEIAMLGAGFSPLLVRPGNLVLYRDLIRNFNRPFIGGTLTENGTTTVVSHPAIIYPTRPRRN